MHSSTLLLFCLNPPPKLGSCESVQTEVVEDGVHDRSAHSACLLRLYLCFPLPCSNQAARQHLLDPKTFVSQHSTQSSPSQLFSVLYYLYFSGYICTPLLLLLGHFGLHVSHTHRWQTSAVKPVLYTWNFIFISNPWGTYWTTFIDWVCRQSVSWTAAFHCFSCQ